MAGLHQCPHCRRWGGQKYTSYHFKRHKRRSDGRHYWRIVTHVTLIYPVVFRCQSAHCRLYVCVRCFRQPQNHSLRCHFVREVQPPVTLQARQIVPPAPQLPFQVIGEDLSDSEPEVSQQSTTEQQP